MSDPHEKLRKRLEQFPINCVPGKGILEFLRLLFTEQEAELLSKFKSFQNFVTIEEFARKNGYNKELVHDTFHNLGKRNLIRYEKKRNKESWCIQPFVVGLYEAFFSAWKEQDPSTLVPAALAAEEFLNTAFYKAVSGSKFPWARVITSVKVIDQLIEKNPHLYSEEIGDQDEVRDSIKRSTSLLKYGIKEAQKRIETEGFEGAIDLIKEDGPLILKSFGKIASSFLGFGKNFSNEQSSKPKDPFMNDEKIISIDTNIPTSLIVYPHESIRNFIDQASSISITGCSCRKHHEILDDERSDSEKVNCKYPIEDTCFQLRYDNEISHEYNMMGGREITKEEAIKILDDCERAGLVHNTFNSREKVEFICNCCPCCCGILGTLLKHDQEYRAFVESNFLPYHIKEQCLKCGKCVKICPVKAISTNNENIPVIESKSCIGCGICVSNCPNNALELIKVTDNKPALDAIEALVNFANQKIR